MSFPLVPLSAPRMYGKIGTGRPLQSDAVAAHGTPWDLCVSREFIEACRTGKSAHLPCVEGVTKPSLGAASAFLGPVFPDEDPEKWANRLANQIEHFFD